MYIHVHAYVYIVHVAIYVHFKRGFDEYKGNFSAVHINVDYKIIKVVLWTETFCTTMHT